MVVLVAGAAVVSVLALAAPKEGAGAPGAGEPKEKAPEAAGAVLLVLAAPNANPAEAAGVELAAGAPVVVAAAGLPKPANAAAGAGVPPVAAGAPNPKPPEEEAGAAALLGAPPNVNPKLEAMVFPVSQSREGVCRVVER